MFLEESNLNRHSDKGEEKIEVESNEKNHKKEKKKLKGKYDTYYPLNAQPSQIFEDTYSTDFAEIKHSFPVKEYANTNKSKYCVFHERHGNEVDK
ncbi:hypothetical protein SESBI_18516 [Sesbania bispinosa]|nr:hypothetical protein SESBI_18516 [Sesbania bispinosa]